MNHLFTYYKKIILFTVTIFAFSSINAFSQCSVTSSNGWVANFKVTPIKIIPEFTSCPYYYHYEIQYNLSVTFTGSPTNRSLSCNLYFNCTGGTGIQPYNAGGLFTANRTVTLQTQNAARMYTSITTNNYGTNPNCNQINLSHTNCSTITMDYWGNGLNGSITFPISSALPITLLSFDATPSNNGIDLSWITASEKNNDFFTLEKSSDGLAFQEIAKIKGAGNSNQQNIYNYTDKEFFQDLNYYRLKQTDFDGSFVYFPIIGLHSSKKDPQLTVISNPTHDFLRFNFIDLPFNKSELLIFEALGKIVLVKELQASEENSIYKIDIQNLANGMYFSNLKDKYDKNHSFKFIKF